MAAIGGAMNDMAGLQAQSKQADAEAQMSAAEMQRLAASDEAAMIQASAQQDSSRQMVDAIGSMASGAVGMSSLFGHLV
jgi:hypothetical protein